MIVTDNNIPDGNFVSRLSKMQKEILSYLATTPQPIGDYIGELVTSGDVIDALGRSRTPANYAAISKALRRLEGRGLVSSARGVMASPGRALRYYLTRGEPTTGRYGVTVFVISGNKAPRRYRNHMTIDTQAA